MDYRTNRRTGDKIGVIALGTSVLDQGKEGVATLEAACEAGVNYFDLASAESGSFPLFGEALASVRDRVRYQIHFGAVYRAGKSYAWTLALDKVKASIDWQLSQLKTDYIDYGFIHCIDEAKDWDKYRKNGILDHILSLKEQGIVRHVGFSTHTPKVAQLILDADVADMMMFSINAAYDCQHGEFARGSGSERMALYQRAEAMGVGITVMKTFSGGQLLGDGTSPFGKALTPWQCIQYVLDKPGVLAAVCGVKDRKELAGILRYFETGPEERDYAEVSSLTPADMEGRCVYCNHCQPCPAGIDVGLVNKYYDLSRAGDALAADHYRHMELRADSCTDCGHCNRRCPFHVDQMARMKEIHAHFAALA